VKDAGNPILLDLKTRYVVKGIGKEQTIQSLVAIHTDEQGKISKVEDKWDGKLPESGIANVSSVFQLLNPFWWGHYWVGWGFWVWSWTWETQAWRVRAFPVLACFPIRCCRIFADKSTAGFPTLECCYGSQDDQRAEKCGGGCEEGKLMSYFRLRSGFLRSP